MVGVGGGELPPLSQILSANWGYLPATAAWYIKLAAAWDAAFTEVRDGLTNPGGGPWDGYGSAAAQWRGQSDLMTIFGKTEQLRNAAAVLTRGFDKQTANQESVREAVADVMRDEFTVADDYAVSDTREATTETEYQERLDLANQHANYLSHRVYALLSNEQQLARDHTQAIDGIEDLNFPAGDGESQNGQVVLVDNEVPLAPGGPLPLAPFSPADFTKVEKYMYGEMMKNLNSEEVIQMNKDWTSLSPYRMEQALSKWYQLVHPGGRWDHKSVLQDLLNNHNPDELYLPEPGTDRLVSYDIWSNIHYGFEGRAVGFPRLILDKAHQMAGAGQTDMGDILSVRAGMDMWPKLGNIMTFAQFDQAVRGVIDQLAAAQRAGEFIPQIRLGA